MNLIGKNLILVLMLVILTACTSSVAQKQAKIVQPNPDRVLYASGYGRLTDDANLSVNQRWLKAQQTAKLVADRALAAQIYQEPLSGQKTVAAQVLANDAYRIYVDSYLRTAQAIDYHTLQDVLQVKMTLKLTQRFYQCLDSDVSGINECLQIDNKLPLTRIGYKTSTQTTVSLACATAACAEQYDIQGFSRKPELIDDTLLAAGLYDHEWAVHTSFDLITRLFLIKGLVHGF